MTEYFDKWFFNWTVKEPEIVNFPTHRPVKGLTWHNWSDDGSFLQTGIVQPRQNSAAKPSQIFEDFQNLEPVTAVAQGPY